MDAELDALYTSGVRVCANSADAPTARIIPNSATLDVRNLGALPRGTGARYLEVIPGLDGEFVAKAWRRKVPASGLVIDLDAPKTQTRGHLGGNTARRGTTERDNARKGEYIR